MGTEGIVGFWNDVTAYLRDLNMVSTIFRLVLAMALGCVIGIDRGMKRRVAGVKTHTIVCLGATLVHDDRAIYSSLYECGRHRRYSTSWRAGYQRRRLFGRRHHYGCRAASCVRADDGSKYLDKFVYRAALDRVLLQRCHSCDSVYDDRFQIF